MKSRLCLEKFDAGKPSSVAHRSVALALLCLNERRVVTSTGGIHSAIRGPETESLAMSPPNPHVALPWEWVQSILNAGLNWLGITFLVVEITGVVVTIMGGYSDGYAGRDGGRVETIVGGWVTLRHFINKKDSNPQGSAHISQSCKFSVAEKAQTYFLNQYMFPLLTFHEPLAAPPSSPWNATPRWGRTHEHKEWRKGKSCQPRSICCTPV